MSKYPQPTGDTGVYFKFSDTGKPKVAPLQMFVPFRAGVRGTIAELACELARQLTEAAFRAGEGTTEFDRVEVDFIPQVFDMSVVDK